MPDDIQPDRLDALVDGEVASGATESEFADLLNVLRGDRQHAPGELRRRVVARAEGRARRRGWRDVLRWPTLGAGLAPVVAAAALIVAVWPIGDTPRLTQATSTASTEFDSARKSTAPRELTQAAGSLEGDQPRATASPERLRTTQDPSWSSGAADAAATPSARASSAPTRPKAAQQDERPSARVYVAAGLGLGASALLGAVIASWCRRRRLPRAFLGP
jgi:hypothetical protein